MDPDSDPPFFFRRNCRKTNNPAPRSNTPAPPLMPEIMPTWDLLLGLVGTNSPFPLVGSGWLGEEETLTALLEKRSPTRESVEPLEGLVLHPLYRATMTGHLLEVRH
jgi:hypothetical protein